MIKCENKCPLDKFEGCCGVCPDRENCPEKCEEHPGYCGESVFDEESALTAFKNTQLSTLNAIANLSVQKKQIEEQEKKMKEQLKAAMEKYGVKTFETDEVKFTYVAPTTRTTIDSTKLKKDLPDVAAQYSKTSPVSASVKITVKEK